MGSPGSSFYLAELLSLSPAEADIGGGIPVVWCIAGFPSMVGPDSRAGGCTGHNKTSLLHHWSKVYSGATELPLAWRRDNSESVCQSGD